MKANPAMGSNQKKIADFYAMCMDTTAIDASAIKPIAADLSPIDKLKESSELQPLISRLQQTGSGYLFNFDSTQDLDDTTQGIAQVEQGGLGLPARDYYTRSDDKSKQLRADYVAHIAKMFALAADSPEKADAEAQTALNSATTMS